MVIPDVTKEDAMKPQRQRFEHAVQAFSSLLNEPFWLALADLLGCPFAENIFFIYGPNKIEVTVGSPFFLGHYNNDPILLALPPRAESEGQPAPNVLLGDVEVSTRFALSGVYGFLGTPVSHDPHRLLTNLLCEVEGRVELLSAFAHHRGQLALSERINDFEAEYFPRLRELIALYNSEELLMPKKPFPLLMMKLQVSWWG
ncbi:MAG TPA: hypothetical protein VJ579_03115 [Candidatus Paceibacterota bacterium]|nr:hypothetical protein [Candidatus Paceibacterota bacterium]